MIMRNIDCSYSDWISDCFTRIPVRIWIDLFGPLLELRLTDQENIICFRNSTYRDRERVKKSGNKNLAARLDFHPFRPRPYHDTLTIMDVCLVRSTRI